MSNMQGFEHLFVWQKSHQLAQFVYRSTESFPDKERYGLTSQFRRAAVSIGANIAEGKGRRTAKELANFLGIARGSAYECLNYCYLARDLNYLLPETCQKLCSEIAMVIKGLDGLIVYVRCYADK